MLRKKGVVGKFVEFCGPGLADAAAGRPRHHRQHGARVRRHHAASSRSTTRRCDYLRLTGRPTEQVGAGRGLLPRSRGCSATPSTPEPSSPTRSSSTWARVEPSLAGPRGRRTACAAEAPSLVRRRPGRLRRASASAPASADRAGTAEAQRDGRAGASRRRRRLRAAARRGGDRRHHQLHQHLQPVGDARRRPAGAEARCERGLQRQAVGEDQPGAGLARW